MEEEDIMLFAQEISRLQQPILNKLDSINNTLQKQSIRANKSIRATIDLTTAHIDLPLSIKESDRIHLWLTIERADSPFTYRLGQPNGQKSEPFNGIVGANLTQHEFTEIYITNAAAVGQAIILIGWRE